MKRLSLLILCGLAAGLARAQAPVTNLLVTLDPPTGGKQVVTLNLTPTATFVADTLEAVCQYQQEFPWPPKEPKGKRITKPAVFTYRTRDVKFVNGLDLHVSFFVPVDIKELREKHGETVFTPVAPATISRVTVTALEKDKRLWSFEANPTNIVGDGVLR